MRRFGILPNEGYLIVSTDLHGNGHDFRALHNRFDFLLNDGIDVHWAILGDLVHAPSPEARVSDPRFYDYDDESWYIVESVDKLSRKHPDRIWLVLGNHDFAHLAGPRTSKFYDDEVAYLESKLSEDQIAVMKQLFDSAYLVLASPCGILFAHGSPGLLLQHPEQINTLNYESLEPKDYRLLKEILTSYGQSNRTTSQMLQNMSLSTGLELKLVVHGHDRDENGWFTEEGNQLQPVIFGAYKETKRYLEINLAGSYLTVDAIRDGFEIKKLYG